MSSTSAGLSLDHPERSASSSSFPPPVMGGEGAPHIFCNCLLRQASIIQDTSSISESPGEGKGLSSHLFPPARLHGDSNRLPLARTCCS